MPLAFCHNCKPCAEGARLPTSAQGLNTLKRLLYRYPFVFPNFKSIRFWNKCLFYTRFIGYYITSIRIAFSSKLLLLTLISLTSSCRWQDFQFLVQNKLALLEPCLRSILRINGSTLVSSFLIRALFSKKSINEYLLYCRQLVC